ncbi:MAG: Transcriptional regulator, LysR-family [Frankiales bacterium]|nr:Transcriptional regulator, LysR-family [Frankiales bacterium]
MDLRQAEYFLAVVEEGSFTRAAARLFMVQSSLSASLLSLERELGTDLFIRGRLGAALTDAGRAFLVPARAMLAEAERARDAVAEVKGLLRGSARVAVVGGSDDLVETLCRFRAQHPGVEVHVVPADPKSVAGLVADGHVDFAITPRVECARPALQFDPLMSTPLVLVCPTAHPLAGASDVEPADIADEAIIDLPKGWPGRDLFDRVIADRGRCRRVMLEINDWFGVLTMVEHGAGISYGPEVAINAKFRDSVAVATLADAPAWDRGVAYRDDALRGAAGRALLAAYRWRVTSRFPRGEAEGAAVPSAPVGEGH